MPGSRESTGMGFWHCASPCTCQLVSSALCFLPHRQMIVWCPQMASCSTSSGCCSSWVPRSSWRRLIPCTYSIPGVESSSPQMRQEWKQQWRRLQPGLLNFVSTLTDLLSVTVPFVMEVHGVLDSSKEFPSPKSLFSMLSAFPCFKGSWIWGLTLDKAVHFLAYSPVLFSGFQTGIHLFFLSPSSPRNASSWRCRPITCPSCPAAAATSAGCAPSGSSTGLLWGSPGRAGTLRNGWNCRGSSGGASAECRAPRFSAALGPWGFLGAWRDCGIQEFT